MKCSTLQKKYFSCFSHAYVPPLKAFILFLTVFFNGLVIAQTKSLSGVVNGIDGQPLQEVSVIVKGNRTGTKTDASGQFKIEVRSNSVMLIFSSVGYHGKEVEVADKT